MKSILDLSALWIMSTAGDQEAFAVLHKELYPGLFSYILRVVNDEAAADDLAQDMFIKIWNKRLQIGALHNVKAYFFSVARSVVINYVRKIKSQRSKLERLPQVEMAFSHEDILIGTECDTEMKRSIAIALNALPSRQKEIIYLRFYEKMEYNKIAEITGIKYQSVINHVFRALQTLREEWRQLKSLPVLTDE